MGRAVEFADVRRRVAEFGDRATLITVTMSNTPHVVSTVVGVSDGRLLTRVGQRTAANLAERAWAVMDRGMPYVICDIDGTPVTPEEAKAIIADHWTVSEQVRRRRRSKKGKAPQQVLTGHPHGAQGATRRPSPSSATLGRQPSRVKPTHPQP